MENQVVSTERASVPALTPEGERFALRQRQAKMFAMSPLVPDHLRKGPPEQAIANCWIALTLAEAMGEVPLIVMQNIHVVNGKAGFASQYMIARANSSGVFKGRIDWRLDRSDPNNLSVTAFAIIRETGQEVSVTCDMKMAKAEGWTKNPKYSSMADVMLRYRSAAFLVRFYAPDVMLGYQTTEEIEDVVASAAPAAPALSAKMLIEQSRSAETPHDPETGEIAGTEEERPDNSQPGEPIGGFDAEDVSAAIDVAEEGLSDLTGSTMADQIGLDEPHPAAAKADAIIAEIEAAGAIIDVNSIMARNRVDIDSMPEELAERIATTAEDRKSAITASRQQTELAK